MCIIEAAAKKKTANHIKTMTGSERFSVIALIKLVSDGRPKRENKLRFSNPFFCV